MPIFNFLNNASIHIETMGMQIENQLDFFRLSHFCDL